MSSLMAKFMGPTKGPPGADRTHVGPMWATWTFLSGIHTVQYGFVKNKKFLFILSNHQTNFSDIIQCASSFKPQYISPKPDLHNMFLLWIVSATNQIWTMNMWRTVELNRIDIFNLALRFLETTCSSWCNVCMSEYRYYIEYDTQGIW